MNNTQTEIDKITQAIATQEALRGTLSDDELAVTLTALRQKQAELTALSGGGDSVGGDKLTAGAISDAHGVAIGNAAKAVSERGVLVTGSVSGNIITGDQNKVGGIQAKTIKAQNVVQGMQQLGGDLSHAADAVALAEALSGGSITADSIEAVNVVAGLQYIADPANATPDELRQQVAELQRQLAEALADAEIEADADMEDIQDALNQVESELEKPQPHGGRIVRKLKEAADILTESAKTTDAARQTGIALIRFAPVAAALYQISRTLFGG